MIDEKRKFKILALIAVIFGFIGFFFPEITFTPIQYINATSIANYSIPLYSGNITSISSIDTSYAQFNESNSPWYIDINFTNITHFSYIEVKGMYFSTSGSPSQHEVEVEVWCHSEQNFVDVTEFIISPDEVYFTRRFPDSMHFIKSNGNVTIRFNHTPNGNTNHRFRLNTVRLINQSHYYQIVQTTNNYYNTTTGGGGGISFNGSPVNANGSNIYNVTIDSFNISYLNSNLSNKVNKTGDNMTGNLGLMTTIYASIYSFNGSDCIGGLNSNDYGSLNIGADIWSIGRCNINNTWYLGKYGFLRGYAMGFVGDSAIGHVNRGFRVQTFDVNSTVYTDFFQSHEEATTVKVGNFTVSKLAVSGSGNWSIVMVDSTGKFFAIPMNGSGNHYGCFNQSGYPYPGNPGC